MNDCDDGSDESVELCGNGKINGIALFSPFAKLKITSFVCYSLETATTGTEKSKSEDSYRWKMLIVFSCVAATVFILVLFAVVKRAKMKQKSLYSSPFVQTTATYNVESSYISETQSLSRRMLEVRASISLQSVSNDTGDSFYNRDDLTGQSRSAVGQVYHSSLTNPPPSPVTERSHFTSVSGKYYDTPSPSTYELHVYHRPSMPNYSTPVTTDIESSVSKYIQYKQTSSAYSSFSDVDLDEGDIRAPPPTVCTNYFSEGLHFSDNEGPPPSPSSDMEFIQEPEPPPPSPVTDSPSVA